MRSWASILLLITGTSVPGCAGGDNPAGDSFTFGGADGGTMGGGTIGMTSVADGTDGTAGSGNGDSNNDSNADGVNCNDGDGDDYGDGCAAGPDCDDTNPDVNPGASEACNGQDDNCDGEIDNGCDCPEDGVSGACNSPTDLGMIDVGGSNLSVVGTVPQETAVDWYTVSYPAASRPGMGIPTIGFAINTGDAFVFDVVQNQCDAGGATCTMGGDAMNTAIGLTSWSFEDNDPGCCTPPMDSLVPWPNQIYVRVYRTTVGASCDTYQLQVSR